MEVVVEVVVEAVDWLAPVWLEASESAGGRGGQTWQPCLGCLGWPSVDLAPEVQQLQWLPVQGLLVGWLLMLGGCGPCAWGVMRG